MEGDSFSAGFFFSDWDRTSGECFFSFKSKQVWSVFFLRTHTRQPLPIGDKKK